MIHFCKRFDLFKKIASAVLIIAISHTVGPLGQVFAFDAQSQTYRLISGTFTEGGGNRSAPSTNLQQDAVGEPSAAKSQSVSYILNAGFIPAIQPNPPQFMQPIPNQSWKPNESKSNAFDLDDYFFSPDGLALNYTVNGNTQIKVEINPNTHLVSLSQPQNWYGTEKVIFTATDTEGNSIQSNWVTLQVQGSGVPPVLEHISDITVNETELVKITPKATDADGDPITYSFTTPLDSNGQWLTTYADAGEYLVTVTAADSTGLIDSQKVKVTVINVNRPPVLAPIADITANEGELVDVASKVVVSDPDNEAISLYYTPPLDETGKWLTTYDDAGIHTAAVTASDGTDTVSQNVKITIINVNRSPQVILTLDKYTVAPKELIHVSLSANDPDNDPMTFSLKKDNQEIASGNITDIYTTTTSFPSMGDKTITAKVTDSGGLSSVDTKGVDVIDPNVDRDAINPVMGDFNGDALSDLGLHNSDTGNWEICISDRGEFRNAVDWLTGFGTSKDWWPIGGDFNGDGKGDVGIYNNKTGQLKIGISSGSSFSVQGTWLTASFAHQSWKPVTGNFNGDKYTDFTLYNKDTGEVKVALGTGSGFSAFNTWISGFGTECSALSGDFNGDGLTDFCLFNKSSGEFKVAFSNTKAFVDGSMWISGFATNESPFVSDFNNDGLSDIGWWNRSHYQWNYAISTGTQFVEKGLWINKFGGFGEESASTGDFNGDGITDPALFDRDAQGIDRWTVKLSTKKPADLLTEVDNGIGGKTQVNYTYAAEQNNPDLPFPVHVASSISFVDTLPADQPEETYTQNFSYSGGYFDAKEREFRGFGKVTVTDPITNNYTETHFFQGKPGQDGALKGKIEKIVAYDGNARKISETQNSYEVKTAGPEDRFLGFPALKDVTTTVWEENAASLTTKDTFTYDNIGNITETINHGDVSQPGDERYSYATYKQAYEKGFNKPLDVIAKDDKKATVSSKKYILYDERGNLEKEEVWLYNPLTNTEGWIPITYTYDSFGNRTSTTNAKGSTVTTQYETTFHTFPETVTNSLGHTINYTYDPRFGVDVSVTDANGATSTTILDSLGRVIEAKNAYGETITTYSYPDFNTNVTTKLNLSTTQYSDGLGRKYKTVSSGEDGRYARQIVSETFYDNRGHVERESLRHYIDEDPANISYVRYEYDIRGRVKKTISDFPGELNDAAATINYINPLYTETVNPRGIRKGTRKDVYGNIVEVIEFTSGGVYHTYYEYDSQNNLIKTTDAQNNINQIFYDSLGRKIKMIDPDMGTWAYEYDEVGNLIKQTDAKAQVLGFEYDKLNRLTKKTTHEGLQTKDLAVYFYDDNLKDNCIGRLSKVIDQSGSIEFFYDKLGREVKSIKTVDGTTYTVERSYDLLDRLTTLKYPDGEVVKYSYDVHSGFLEKVYSDSGPSSIDYVRDISYSAQGQIKTLQYGNNTQTNYSYGNDQRLSRISTKDSSVTTLQDLNYGFDHNGNITTLTDNLKSNIRTFTYDDLDRLTSAKNIPEKGGWYTDFYYQYDSIGNMTYKSDVGVMEYGVGAGPHAVTSAGGYTYQYDANGNMISGKDKTFEYDGENRLIKVDELGVVTTFVYDGDGGRVKKITTSPGQQIINETTYIGSIYEVDQDGIITKHVFGGGNRVCSLKSDGTVLYYHKDHLGSSTVITDKYGNKVAGYEYQPYGKISQQIGIDSTSYKFTGKELDSTGLYFYSARYYDPEIGRFTQADIVIQSLFDPQTFNRYTYCRNNPLIYVDPSGHFFFGIIIGALIGGLISGVTSAVTGGDFGKGFLMGAITGAFFGAAGGIINSLKLQGLVAAGIHAIAGAGSGAINTAISGGNIGLGALIGGLSAGASYWLGHSVSFLRAVEGRGIGGYLANVTRRAAIGGIVGGGISAAMGGSFVKGALQGAYTSAYAYTFNEVVHSLRIPQTLSKGFKLFRFRKRVIRTFRAQAYYLHKGIKMTDRDLYTLYIEHLRNEGLIIDCSRDPIELVIKHNIKSVSWLNDGLPLELAGTGNLAYHIVTELFLKDPDNLYGRMGRVIFDGIKVPY